MDENGESIANGAHSLRNSPQANVAEKRPLSNGSSTSTPARGAKKPRAPHTKSRQGCLRCKRRRVKCNEEQPKCRACQIRGEDCRYPEKVACSTCLRIECVCFDNALPPVQHADESSVDFEFIYHYGRFTYDTVFLEPINEHAKPLFTPPDCLQYPFLMDLYMALAATHLATLNPAEASRYTVHAIRYQNRAFGRFSGTLVDPKVEDCLPMFLFSAMLGILQLALSRIPQPADHLTPPIETLLELRRLWKGSRSILQHSKNMMPPDAYASIFDNDEDEPRRSHIRAPPTNSDLQGECWLPLKDLLNLVETTFPSPTPTSFSITPDDVDNPDISDDDACKIAIAYLRRVTAVHLSHRPALLLAWPVIIADKFLHLVHEEHPRAQAICACYGFLLRRLNDRWWARGFGQDLILQLASTSNRDVYKEFYGRIFESAMSDG
ncbi:hypothetical protein DOTSEDRAFT_180893 [Dothistroma septosporum NZE10]|uniref:Zn(2)-C6 fungal-type domain-containing protein n=1 Tax=Dothistroma septosporum (strain NZE10 / CBS 128990) TaxID=675120 RepID=M2WIW3_DOTSN|nr:hypothetical protein DOTSEDRAFT_180893 [Dothistroma septosporum NZE10]